MKHGIFTIRKSRPRGAYCGTEFSLNRAMFVAKKNSMPSGVSHIRNVTAKLVHKINFP